MESPRQKQEARSYATSNEYLDLARNRLRKSPAGHEILTGQELKDRGVRVGSDLWETYIVQKVNQRKRAILDRSQLPTIEPLGRTLACDVYCHDDLVAVRFTNSDPNRSDRQPLHRDFATRLSGSNEDALLFADRYGIQGFCKPCFYRGADLPLPRASDTSEPVLAPTMVAVAAASLRLMRGEAHFVEVLTNALIDGRPLREEEYEMAFSRLRKFLNMTWAPKDAVMDASIPPSPEERRDRLADIARVALAQHLKSATSPHLDSRRTVAFEVNDLRSAIYLGLLDELHNGHPLYRMCKECRWAFEVHDARQQFCPRRECKDAFNRRSRIGK